MSKPFPSHRGMRSCVYLTALVISMFAWFAPTSRAQVTVYTDEASFNAATANLNFLLETYEGIAPAGGNGYPAVLVSPGADIFSPFSVSNADVYTTSTPQYIEVDDAAYNKISLNGSASLTVIQMYGAPLPTTPEGVPTTVVTMTTDNSATTAFGTEFGLRDPFGPGMYEGGHVGGPATYPLTDTVDVQLYYHNYADLSTTPVGGVFHAGSVVNGYLGFVSTQPFNRITYSVIHTVDIYDSTNYIIDDPYHMTWDNSRFGSPPIAPSYLYVSDFAAGEIYGYSNVGVPSDFTNNLVNPVALAFDSAGNLYEGDSGSGTIYKASTTGSQSVFASGFGQIVGLAFDASGNLFVSSTDAGKVGSITRITPAGVQSSFASGLTRARGLAFDGAGNLYNAELDTGSVYKYTPAGVKSTFASGFNYPTGIAFDATGNLFVCSQGVGVFKVTAAGVVSTFTTNVTDPRYLAFDGSGNLFVTDVGDASGTPGQGNVYQFAPDGTRTTFATNLAFPAGIAFTVAPATATSVPVISSATSGTAQVGQPFTYQITASNTPTRFAASGLPAGLSVNARNGLISGTPTASGSFAVSLSAANAGGTGSAALTLVVAPAPVALPSVSLVATIPQVAAGSEDLAEFTLSLSAAQDHDVVVSFTIKGTAVNGTDYMLINSTKKIKAGKTSKPIKIFPQGDLGGASKKTVVLTLQLGTGYQVSTPGKVKVKITD